MNDGAPTSGNGRAEDLSVTEDQQPERDLFFDPWLIARGPALIDLVDRTQGFLDFHEERTKVRRRARKAADLDTHHALVETVVANLVYTMVDPRGRSLAVSLSKRPPQTRYDRRILRLLRPLLRRLQDMDILVLTVSSDVGRMSTVRPSAWFERQVKQVDVEFADFGHHPDEEVVILTRTWRDYSDVSGRVGARREWIEYDDTVESRRYRRQMRQINSALAAAQIDFASGDSTSPIDVHNRRLKRFFSLPVDIDTPTFNLNGRLFGGWWQNLERSLRRFIRIEGEPVVDLDYASMFPRLAYLAAGHTPPDGDLYAIEGLRSYRNGVKRALNTLLFADGRRSRLPTEVKADLPQEWTLRRVRAALLEKHPALSSVIERGLGLTLMFQESKVLVSLLLKLLDSGTVALPMHDGVMVARSRADATRVAMEDAAREVLGVSIPVTVKDLV